MAKLTFGSYEALRWTRFCVVWRSAPLAAPATCSGEKSFGMHSIGYQMKGGWNFHGKRRVESVDCETVVAASPGQRYGCEHGTRQCDTVCAISLRAGALDEDQVVFSRQVLPGLRLPPLAAVLKLDDDDLFDSMIFDIFDLVSRASLGTVRVERTDFRTQRMKRFIEQHAFEAVTLAEIAESVGLSPFTCIRRFKESAGATPMQYLRSLRLQRAKKLLENPRLTVGEVARLVGIRDRFYFSRVFSREVGITPQTFRRIVQH